MTTPAMTGDKKTLGLAKNLMKALRAGIDQKSIEMKKAKKECQDLEKLPEDERGDKTNHTQRLEET